MIENFNFAGQGKENIENDVRESILETINDIEEDIKKVKEELSVASLVGIGDESGDSLSVLERQIESLENQKQMAIKKLEELGNSSMDQDLEKAA